MQINVIGTAMFLVAVLVVVAAEILRLRRERVR